MIPILFSKNETQFVTNGLGRLHVIDCVVEEERNGSYEARFTISENEKHFSEIEILSIVVMKVSDGTLQPFIVYKIENSINDLRTVYCEHNSYKLKGIPVMPFQALSANGAFSSLKQKSVINNPFTFFSNVTTSGNMNLTRPESARACLGGMEGSILDTFGGEYKFDKWEVMLLSSRGSDRGVALRYGKNITDLSDDNDVEDTVTGILPYWSNGEWLVVGDITYSNNQLAPLQNIVVEDVSSEFSDETYSDNEGEKHGPTKAEVTAKGHDKLLTKSYPGIMRKNLKVSFVNLADTEEYKKVAPLENVQLCDMVTVIFEPYNITAKMKVTKTTWNVLEEKYESIELGDMRQNLVTEIVKKETDLDKAIRLLNDSQAKIKKRFEVVEDGLELEVSTRTEQGEEIFAELDLRILNEEGDGGQELISMINGHADLIHFTANKIFKVDAPNWSVNEDGEMILMGTIYGKSTDPYSPIDEIIQISNFNPLGGCFVKFLGDVVNVDVEANLPGVRCLFEDSSVSPLEESWSSVEILGGASDYSDGNAFIVNADDTRFNNAVNFKDVVEFKGGRLSGTMIGYNVHTQKVQINDIGVTTSPANIHISESQGTDPDTALPTGNYLQKVDAGSSLRYKNSVSEELTEEMNPQRLYSLPIVKFKYNTDYLTNEEDNRYDKEVIGFIAEDMAKIYPQACEYNSNGQPDAWNEHYIIPPMLKLIQEQHEEIEKLKKRIEKLEKGGN